MKMTNQEATLNKSIEDNLRDKLFEAVLETLAEHAYDCDDYSDIDQAYIQGEMYEDTDGLELDWDSSITARFNLDRKAYQAIDDIVDWILVHGSCKVRVSYETWSLRDEDEDEDEGGIKNLFTDVSELTFDDMMRVYFYN